MASPTVAATLDKATYNPGDTARLTVTYADADNTSQTLTITVSDAAGHTATTTVVLVTSDTVTLAVTDTARAWSKVSDTGAVAVFTATV